jgi:hypothetical protein
MNQKKPNIMNQALKKTFFITIFSLITLTVSAQQNFINGFVVSLKGDTTKGLINYKNWRKNPTDIQFKKDNSASINTYKPSDIESFGVKLTQGTEVYKSAKVLIETSSNNLESMDKMPEFNSEERNLFLLTIISGNYGLYKFEDQKEHFFVQNGGRVTELQSKSYLWEKRNTVVKNEHYKAQLTDLFKDCSKITEKDISGLSYGEPELIKIFKKYAECTGSTSNQSVISDKATTVFGLVLATDISKFKIKSTTFRNVDISSSGNFAVGISMAIILPRNNKSSSFNAELLYRKYKFENTTNEAPSTGLSYQYNNIFDGSYAKLNLMYRYQWTTSSLKPFLNIGFSQGYALSKIDKSRTQKTFFTTVTEYDDPIITSERKYEQGLILGFGLNVKKVNIELRAESTTGFSAIPKTKTSINTLGLNLNYQF